MLEWEYAEASYSGGNGDIAGSITCPKMFSEPSHMPGTKHPDRESESLYPEGETKNENK